MNCISELAPWSMEVVALSTSLAFLWDPQWHPCTGVTSVDFLADVRNVGGANLILKPAIQYAAVRTDRPGAGAVILAGSDITAAGAYSFKETLSGSTQFFFRRGVGYKLDSGTFARADNANDAMDWRIYGRAFNDKLARGGWTPLGADWNHPAAGDFTPVNTGELDLGDLSLSSKHWMELALAVKKGAGTDANSRCIFQVATALKYA